MGQSGCSHNFGAAESSNKVGLSKDRKVLFGIGATCCEHEWVSHIIPLFKHENHVMHLILHWTQLSYHYEVDVATVDYACQYKKPIRRFLDWLETETKNYFDNPGETTELPEYYLEHYTKRGNPDDRALGSAPFGSCSLKRAILATSKLCLNSDVFASDGGISKAVGNVWGMLNPAGTTTNKYADAARIAELLFESYSAIFTGGVEGFVDHAAAPDWFNNKVTYSPSSYTCNAHTKPSSHRIASYRIASYQYGIASHRIAFHRIASHCIESHRVTYTEYSCFSFLRMQLPLSLIPFMCKSCCHGWIPCARGVRIPFESTMIVSEKFFPPTFSLPPPPINTLQ